MSSLAIKQDDSKRSGAGVKDGAAALPTADEATMDVLRFLRTEKADGRLRDKHRVERGPQPVKHNYYTDHEFFRHDSDKGIVTNVYGQRVVRVSEDFITGLLGGLGQHVGDAAGEIMYKAGLQWGMQDMQSFMPRAAAEFEVQFNKLSMGMMLETWWWPLRIEGWGDWRYDFRQGRQGLMFIDLFESAVAKTLGDVGKVVCYFYAGLFAAVFSTLAKRDLGCVELQCYSMGEDYCKFLIASGKRVDAAAFWRNEGATAKDIQKKVAAETA